MSDFKDLYQQLIIDHGRTPRNFRKLNDANHIKEGHNPLCGDQLTLYVKERDGVIEAVTFEGQGCAISKASASMMTEALTGKTVQEAEHIFEGFHQLVTQGGDDMVLKNKLGKLVVLVGVAEYPARVKCATLAWHTLHSALHDDMKPVSTE